MTLFLPECESDVVALPVLCEAADVVDVEEQLAEVAEEEGEDEEDEDARELGLAPRRRGRGRVLSRKSVWAGYYDTHECTY